MECKPPSPANRKAIARPDVAASMTDIIATKRRDRLKAGTLELTANGIWFTRNEVLGSPRTAAAVISGKSSNGGVDRKHEQGRTLAGVYRQSDT